MAVLCCWRRPILCLAAAISTISIVRYSFRHNNAPRLLFSIPYCLTNGVQFTESVGYYGGSITGIRPRHLYAWIEANHQNSSIALCCQVLGVRWERYYDWKRRPVHTDHDIETVSALKQLRQQHPCYGVRSLREALPKTLRPSYGKCYRLCKENHLLIRQKRPHSLTKTDFHAPQNDDLIRRNFTASAPGTKYISDMTEIKYANSKLYLAAILDCFDSAVVGYAMRPTYARELMLRCVSPCIFPLWLSIWSDPSF